MDPNASFLVGVAVGSGVTFLLFISLLKSSRRATEEWRKAFYDLNQARKIQQEAQARREIKSKNVTPEPTATPTRKDASAHPTG